jgi:phosphatidylglycerol lysyltransferase
MTWTIDPASVGSDVHACGNRSDPRDVPNKHAGNIGDFMTFRPVAALSAAEFHALEHLAYEYGETPYSYLAVESHRHCYLAADHSAAMSVVISGWKLHIFGGILAPFEARRQIITQLGQLAKQTKRLINCYSISEQDRMLFEDEGWEVTKFGEETSLKLKPHSWSGKPYEWVRRQSNYCLRVGLSCREVNHQTMDTISWQKLTQELFDIQREDLAHRVYAAEMNFIVGKLQPDQLGRRRLFIAENEETRRIEGFVVANPMRGGKGWGFEMYRKRQDAPRGCVPFLIKWIIDALKSEGVEEASLCMLLWKDTHQFAGKRTSPLARWGLAVAYHVGDFFYNTKGMTHFKTRFRPELSNCYVCVTPKITVLSCIDFFRVIGAFSFNARNIFRNSWRFFGFRRQSANSSDSPSR